MTAPLAVDTSVAVALLMAGHRQHEAVRRWWAGREIALSGHALAETFSVLTRLPGDARVEPRPAAELIRSRFAPALLPHPDSLRSLPDVLGPLGIVGGAVYDALVALAARDNDAQLATRDARARPTYERLGVTVVAVAVA